MTVEHYRYTGTTFNEFWGVERLETWRSPTEPPVGPTSNLAVVPKGYTAEEWVDWKEHNKVGEDHERHEEKGRDMTDRTKLAIAIVVAPGMWRSLWRLLRISFSILYGIVVGLPYRASRIRSRKVCPACGRTFNPYLDVPSGMECPECS